jgi:hypothetical protein
MSLEGLMDQGVPARDRLESEAPANHFWLRAQFRMLQKLK